MRTKRTLRDLAFPAVPALCVLVAIAWPPGVARAASPTTKPPGPTALTHSFLVTAGAAGASIAPGARCYEPLGVGPPPTGYLCGPVAYATAPLDGVWQQVTASSTGSSPRAILGPHGIRTPPGEQLRAADGT